MRPSATARRSGVGAEDAGESGAKGVVGVAAAGGTTAAACAAAADDPGGVAAVADVAAGGLAILAVGGTAIFGAGSSSKSPLTLRAGDHSFIPSVQTKSSGRNSPLWESRFNSAGFTGPNCLLSLA